MLSLLFADASRPPQKQSLYDVSTCVKTNPLHSEYPLALPTMPSKLPEGPFSPLRPGGRCRCEYAAPSWLWVVPLGCRAEGQFCPLIRCSSVLPFEFAECCERHCQMP